MMRKLLTVASMLAALAAPAAATTHLEYETHSVTIAPGEVVNALQTCTSVALVSGGYSLDLINNGKGKVTAPVLVMNAPVSTNEWGVGLLNPYGTPMTVEFDISILCE
jgi:hypothetical protein